MQVRRRSQVGLGVAAAGVRALAGSVMLLRPSAVGRVLGADPALTPTGDWAVRMLGAREVALGAGALDAVRRGTAGPWLFAGALSDALDVVVLAGALTTGRLGRTPTTRVLAGVCAAGAAVSVAVQVRDAARS